MKLVTNDVAEMVPQPNIVELLENTLKNARDGKLDGVVLLLSWSEGGTSDSWAFGPEFKWVPMVGCAEVWKRRFIARYDEVEP